MEETNTLNPLGRVKVRVVFEDEYNIYPDDYSDSMTLDEIFEGEAEYLKESPIDFILETFDTMNIKTTDLSIDIIERF